MTQSDGWVALPKLSRITYWFVAFLALAGLVALSLWLAADRVSPIEESLVRDIDSLNKRFFTLQSRYLEGADSSKANVTELKNLVSEHKKKIGALARLTTPSAEAKLLEELDRYTHHPLVGLDEAFLAAPVGPLTGRLTTVHTHAVAGDSLSSEIADTRIFQPSSSTAKYQLVVVNSDDFRSNQYEALKSLFWPSLAITIERGRLLSVPDTISVGGQVVESSGLVVVDERDIQFTDNTIDLAVAGGQSQTDATRQIAGNSRRGLDLISPAHAQSGSATGRIHVGVVLDFPTATNATSVAATAASVQDSVDFFRDQLAGSPYDDLSYGDTFRVLNNGSCGANKNITIDYDGLVRSIQAQNPSVIVPGRTVYNIIHPCGSTYGAGAGTNPYGPETLTPNAGRTTMRHEIGHTIMFGHANVMACTDEAGAPVVLIYPGNCSSKEYRDKTDPMGDARLPGLKATHKLQAAAFSASQSRYLPYSSQPQRLALKESSTTGSQSPVIAEVDYLHLPDGSPGASLYIFKRKHIGYDTDLDAYDLKNGVFINYKPHNWNFSTRNADLLDMEPSTIAVTDSLLQAGTSFTAKGGTRNVTISHDASTADAADITVAYDSTVNCTEYYPVVVYSGDSIVSASPNGQSTIRIGVADQSSSICSDRQYAITLTTKPVKPGHVITPTSQKVTVKPGATGFADFTFQTTAIEGSAEQIQFKIESVAFPTLARFLRLQIKTVTPPNISAVTNPVAKLINNGTWVSLSWGAPTTNPQLVTLYSVFRDGAYLARLAPTSFTYSDSTAAAGPHSYVIYPENGTYGRGQGHPPLTVTVVDVTAPTAPTNLKAYQANGDVTVLWTSAYDISGIKHYEVSRNGSVVTTTSRVRFEEHLMTGTYTYTLVAVDSAGNRSIRSAPATIAVDDTGVPPTDTIPPTVPNNVKATTSRDTTTLTWDPSSDNVGVTGYNVWRNNQFIAAVTQTTFTDSGRPRGTDTYFVAAFDAAGNVSASSSSVSAAVAWPPIITISQPTVGGTLVGGKTVTVTYDFPPAEQKDIHHVSFAIDSLPKVDETVYDGSVVIGGVVAGPHSLVVRFETAAGTREPATSDVVVQFTTRYPMAELCGLRLESRGSNQYRHDALTVVIRDLANATVATAAAQSDDTGIVTMFDDELFGLDPTGTYAVTVRGLGFVGKRSTVTGIREGSCAALPTGFTLPIGDFIPSGGGDNRVASDDVDALIRYANGNATAAESGGLGEAFRYRTKKLPTLIDFSRVLANSLEQLQGDN